MSVERPGERSHPEALPDEVGVVIVGAGFSGLAMAARLARSGRRDFLLLERSDDIGGTWRDNAYPGCACDVPSHLYSLSFAPNPDWSRAFSPQAEIWEYMRRVADAEGLLTHVRLRCALLEAEWDGTAQRWRLSTSDGPMTAKALIAAGGPLSEPRVPDLPGIADFTGEAFHSANWPADLDLTGKRVAVVGTGASAIQFIPQIAPAVEHMTVFQRTPPWILPRGDRPIRPGARAVYRRVPAAQRFVRALHEGSRDILAMPLFRRVALSGVTRSIALRHLRKQVPDPELRAKLMPDYAPGCKRLLLSDDYLPALMRPNVELVDQGVTAVRERSVVAADGTERPVDTMIFGTGFRVTEPPLVAHLRGPAGRTLAEEWSGGGLNAHRGTMVAGFPNLFLMLGPNTGLGHTSVLIMVEAQVRYVLSALTYMDAKGVGTVEPLPAAQRAWNTRIQDRLTGTVWNAGGCRSWYLDRSGRNTTLWPDSTIRFRRALRRFDPGEHRLTPVSEPAPTP
jgi:cation diffusion facilitator CzcD-associated flavoprotein CzcO